MTNIRYTEAAEYLHLLADCQLEWRTRISRVFTQLHLCESQRRRRILRRRRITVDRCRIGGAGLTADLVVNYPPAVTERVD